MKRIILIALIFPSSFLSYAQWTENGSATIISTIDSVGIGTIHPIGKLHVVVNEDALSWPVVINNHYNSSTISDYGVGIKLKHSWNHEEYKWGGIASVQEDPWANKSALAFYANEAEYMRIRSNGSVGIGTITTGPHRLAVEGSIGAREVKVEASEWPDFVFGDTYELRTLEEVEHYIAENKHLPEIPGEAEVSGNGINLGEMNAKLLQKIEELTLYLIEQNKQLKEANQNIAELQKEIAALKNK